MLYLAGLMLRESSIVTQSLSAEVAVSLIQRKTPYIFIPPVGKVHALPLYTGI